MHWVHTWLGIAICTLSVRGQTSTQVVTVIAREFCGTPIELTSLVSSSTPFGTNTSSFITSTSNSVPSGLPSSSSGETPDNSSITTAVDTRTSSDESSRLSVTLSTRYTEPSTTIPQSSSATCQQAWETFVVCPASDGITFTQSGLCPGPDTSFAISCGQSFGLGGMALQLDRTSTEDCIFACSESETCVAAAFNVRTAGCYLSNTVELSSAVAMPNVVFAYRVGLGLGPPAPGSTNSQTSTSSAQVTAPSQTRMPISAACSQYDISDIMDHITVPDGSVWSVSCATAYTGTTISLPGSLEKRQSGADNCLSQCGSLQQCIGFTYDGGACTLFSGLTGRRPAAVGFISAFKVSSAPNEVCSSSITISSITSGSSAIEPVIATSLFTDGTTVTDISSSSGGATSTQSSDPSTYRLSETSTLDSTSSSPDDAITTTFTDATASSSSDSLPTSSVIDVTWTTSSSSTGPESIVTSSVGVSSTVATSSQDNFDLTSSTTVTDLSSFSDISTLISTSAVAYSSVGTTSETVASQYTQPVSEDATQTSVSWSSPGYQVSSSTSLDQMSESSVGSSTTSVLFTISQDSETTSSDLMIFPSVTVSSRTTALPEESDTLTEVSSIPEPTEIEVTFATTGNAIPVSTSITTQSEDQSNTPSSSVSFSTASAQASGSSQNATSTANITSIVTSSTNGSSGDSSETLAIETSSTTYSTTDASETDISTSQATSSLASASSSTTSDLLSPIITSTDTSFESATTSSLSTAYNQSSPASVVSSTRVSSTTVGNQMTVYSNTSSIAATYTSVQNLSSISVSTITSMTDNTSCIARWNSSRTILIGNTSSVSTTTLLSLSTQLSNVTSVLVPTNTSAVDFSSTSSSLTSASVTSLSNEASSSTTSSSWTITATPLPTAPVCQSGDQTVYQANDGSTWRLDCNTNYYMNDVDSFGGLALAECWAACVARGPQCGAVNFNPTTSNGIYCYLKSSIVREYASRVGSTTHTLVRLTDGSQLANGVGPVCTAADQTYYQTSDGSIFRISCTAGATGSPLASFYASTYQLCIDRCVGLGPRCLATQYRPDDSGGPKCDLYDNMYNGNIVNSFRSFSAYRIRSISYIAQNPSTGLVPESQSPPADCPAGNQTVWTTSDGSTFRLDCGLDHYGNDIDEIASPNYQHCMRLVPIAEIAATQ